MLHPLDLIQSSECIDKTDGKCTNHADSSASGRSVVCGGCRNPVQLNTGCLRKQPLFGELSDAHNEKHWISVQLCQKCQSIVGISLCGQLWTGWECLRSSNTKDNGIVQVDSYSDRLVLFVLSQVCFQQEDLLEGGKEVTFLCPGPKEFGKIYWINGEAAAFYTLKPKGSTYTSCTYMTYQMPVVDLVYVRPEFRRQGIASAMVADIMFDHPDEDVGFSEPVSDTMLKVLGHYLEVHSDQRDHVWEVSWTGQDGFRNNVWLLLRRLQREKNRK